MSKPKSFDSIELIDILNDGGPLGETVNQGGVLNNTYRKVIGKMLGYQHFYRFLRYWRTVESVTPQEFEELYTILCRTGILDSFDSDMATLFNEVTKQKVDEERLLALKILHFKKHKDYGFTSS